MQIQIVKDEKAGKKVNNIDTKKEIDALIKATQKTGEELKKSWKKVEDLDAAIQSAKNDQHKRKEIKKPN